MSNSSMYLKLKILLLITVLSTMINCSQIVNKLWKLDSIGKVHDLKFIDEREILVSSVRGVFSKINFNGDILWKKNMIYENELELDSIREYSLLVNKKHGYIDLINNSNSQLLWSISFNSGDKIISWDLLCENKNFVGVLVQSKEMRIFNKERVISEIKARSNEEFLDFFINSDKETLNYASVVDQKTIEIHEINISKHSTRNPSKISSIEISNKFNFNSQSKNLFFMTKSFLVMLNSNKEYLSFNYIEKEAQSNYGTLTELSDFSSNIKKFSYVDRLLFINENKIIILTLQSNSISTINLEKENREELFYDKIDNSKKSSLYILRKKNANTYLLASLLLNEKEFSLAQLGKNTINEEITIEKFTINPYYPDTYILNSTNNNIFILEKDKQFYKKIDESLSAISFVDLVSYYNDQGKAQKLHYHTNLESILNGKEIPSIFTNIFKTISYDISEILERLKSSLTSLIENKNSTTLYSKNMRHYLILFTEGKELHILNAIDKSSIINKNFKNKNLVKIIKNTNEDMNRNQNKFIYIILKDLISDNYIALKFDLETTELHEDSNIINEILLEEEIKNQSENLIKNPSESPVSLSGKLQKSVIDKYDNKFTIEILDNSLFGVKYKKTQNGKLDITIAWNLAMKRENNIVPIQDKFPNVHSNLITTYHVQGKVFYKYIDANIILLLSNVDSKSLLISLVRANSGKVLHQSYINNVDFSQKIHSVFEENMIVVSYTKKEKSVIRNEIYAIEIMKREIEHSFVSLLEKIFKFNIFSDSEKSHEESDNIQENDLIFLTQTFILTRKIKGLFISKTLLNVANKYLIFLLENNQVFLLDKRGVSPRRPMMKEEKGKPPVLDPLNSPYIDPELSPYLPLINFDSKFILNINFTEDQIDKILVTPTQFESTFLICTEGLNLSCYDVFPDKTFDTLNMSFAYSLIGLFLWGIIVLTYLLRRYVKRNEFKTSFLSA